MGEFLYWYPDQKRQGFYKKKQCFENLGHFYINVLKKNERILINDNVTFFWL